MHMHSHSIGYWTSTRVCWASRRPWSRSVNYSIIMKSTHRSMNMWARWNDKKRLNFWMPCSQRPSWRQQCDSFNLKVYFPAEKAPISMIQLFLMIQFHFILSCRYCNGRPEDPFWHVAHHLVRELLTWYGQSGQFSIRTCVFGRNEKLFANVGSAQLDLVLLQRRSIRTATFHQLHGLYEQRCIGQCENNSFTIDLMNQF